MGFDVGDRFRYQGATHYHIWEVISPDEIIIVEALWPTQIGYKFTNVRNFNPENYDYLGNFNKMSNFTELYNLMNESN